MKKTVLTTTLSTTVFAAAVSFSMLGCSGSAEPDSTFPTRVFEGLEVQDQLAEDPDALFFVDLREPQAFAFDQRDVAIDFSHFVVQCPSMEQPVPMEDFAQMLSFSLDAPAWTMWSAEFERSPHRSAILEEEWVCNSDGKDCILIDWDDLWDS